MKKNSHNKSAETCNGVAGGWARSGLLRIGAGLLHPYRAEVAVIVLLLMVETAFRVTLPLAYELLFDRAIAGRDLSLLAALLTGLGAALLVASLAGLAGDRVSARVAAKVMNDLRRQMFAQVQRLPASTLRRLGTGGLMSRFSNDLAAIEIALTRSLGTVVLSTIVLGASVVMLFVVEWRLALLTFVTLPAAALGPRLLSGRARRACHARKQTEARLTNSLREVIQGAAVIRVFALEAFVRGRFESELAELGHRAARARAAGAAMGRLGTSGVFFVQLLILGAGGFLAISADLTVGVLASFIALLLNVANAASHLGTAAPELVQADASLRRVGEILEETPRPARLALGLPRLKREIAFDGVTLTYPGSAKPTLSGVTFRLAAGDSMTLVGASGSGKSTLLELLAGLETPDEGRVLVDGRNLALATEASWRDQVAVVPQDTMIFNATVAENIRLGKLDASEGEIEAAARQAGIHERVLALPLAYDTLLGEGGTQLSGGERQRLAIARALVRDPAVLILDEATSALDPATEGAIRATLEELRGHCTVVSVTHRRPALASGERLFVLEHGRLKEIERATRIVSHAA